MTRRVETSPRSATRVLRACQVSVTGVRHDSSAARASVTAPDRRARSAKRKKREKSVGPRAASPREAVRRRAASPERAVPITYSNVRPFATHQESITTARLATPFPSARADPSRVSRSSRERRARDASPTPPASASASASASTRGARSERSSACPPPPRVECPGSRTEPSSCRSASPGAIDAAPTEVATTAANASVARLTKTAGRNVGGTKRAAPVRSASAVSETGTSTVAEVCARVMRGGEVVGASDVESGGARHLNEKPKGTRVTPPRCRARRREVPDERRAGGGGCAYLVRSGSRTIGSAHGLDYPPFGSCDSRSARRGSARATTRSRLYSRHVPSARLSHNTLLRKTNTTSAETTVRARHSARRPTSPEARHAGVAG